MQVSIWSAFSSNHSSRFTVVGVFQTPEQAQGAAKDLESLLRPIEDWYNQPENAEALRARESSFSTDPSPPELAIAAQLGLAWPKMALDWVWFDDEGHSPVTVIDNLVFIDGTQSVVGAHPADGLIRSVGGQALVDGYKDPEGDEVTDLILRLTCIGPDAATAQKIETETTTYLRRSDESREAIFETPWARDNSPMTYSSFEGHVRRTERDLTFTGSFFHIGDGFPALLAYLRGRGCTDIHYDFVEKNAIEEE